MIQKNLVIRKLIYEIKISQKTTSSVAMSIKSCYPGHTKTMHTKFSWNVIRFTVSLVIKLFWIRDKDISHSKSVNTKKLQNKQKYF